MVLMNLLAQLTLDKTAFDKGLDDAQTAAKEFKAPEVKDLKLKTEDYKKPLESAKKGSDEFKAVWDDLCVAVATSGITATIAGVISYLGSAVDSFMNAGQTINDTSKAWGISAKAYQEWAHVLSSSRANIKDLQGGITNINKFLGGNASKNLAGAFDALNISTQDANGNLKTTEQLLNETVTAIANYDKGNKASLIDTIFGGSGKNLNQMFEKGASGIRNLKNEAHDFGLVMSDQQIETALAYDESINNLKDAMASFQQSIGESIVPGLQEVVELMTKIVNFFKGEDGETGLGKNLDGIKKSLAGEAAETEKTANEAKGLVDQLFSMAESTEKTAEQAAIFSAVADELVNKIPQLSEFIDKDTGSLTANKDEIYATIEAWRDYQNQRALALAKEEAGQAVIDKQKEAYEATADAMIAQSHAEAERLSAISKINDILKESSLTGIGQDSSLQDIQKVIDQLGDWGFDLQKKAVEDALKGYTDAQKAADKAADRVTKLDNELSEVNDGWEEYEAALDAAQDKYKGIDSTNASLNQTKEEAAAAKGVVDELNSSLDTLQSKSPVTIDVKTNAFEGEFTYNAKGNWSVPYDNFPAILHRGEQVLTASDARKYRENKNNGNIDLNALAGAIVGAVRDGMDNATVDSFMDGKRVTRQTNRVTGNRMAARRFAPA